MAASLNGEIFRRHKDVYDDEYLDDSALIAAFDNAVNPIKAMLGETTGTTTTANVAAVSAGAKKKPAKRNKGKQRKKHHETADSTNNSVMGQQQWHIGSQCRAVFTEDGRTYDAVIIAIHDDVTCTVRYDYYLNEEVQRLDQLLPAVRSRHRQSSSQRSDVESVGSVDSSPDVRRQNPPHGRQNAPRCTHHHGRDKSSRKDYHPHTHPPVFKFPYPPQPGSFLPPGMSAAPPCGLPGGFPASFPRAPTVPVFPPPPPPPPTVGKLHAGTTDSDNESLYSMLISWYMCGYYTGFYHGLSQCCGSSAAADNTVDASTSEADNSFTQESE